MIESPIKIKNLSKYIHINVMNQFNLINFFFKTPIVLLLI